MKSRRIGFLPNLINWCPSPRSGSTLCLPIGICCSRLLLHPTLGHHADIAICQSLRLQPGNSPFAFWWLSTRNNRRNTQFCLHNCAGKRNPRRMKRITPAYSAMVLYTMHCSLNPSLAGLVLSNHLFTTKITMKLVVELPSVKYLACTAIVDKITYPRSTPVS
jgi:hypothetical protein